MDKSANSLSPSQKGWFFLHLPSFTSLGSGDLKMLPLISTFESRRPFGRIQFRWQFPLASHQWWRQKWNKILLKSNFSWLAKKISAHTDNLNKNSKTVLLEHHCFAYFENSIFVCHSLNSSSGTLPASRRFFTFELFDNTRCKLAKRKTNIHQTLRPGHPGFVSEIRWRGLAAAAAVR